MQRHHGMEALLWSIALPGFGQFLNGHYLKGMVLLALEFLVNVHSHLNEVILLSFTGEIDAAIRHTNYQWLMFYPCLYMFALWDAYMGDAPRKPFAFLPSVFAAFVATVGLIYSRTLHVAGTLPGPVWLTLAGCFVGLGIGYLVKKGIVALIH